jgi:hypothetical protein
MGTYSIRFRIEYLREVEDNYKAAHDLKKEASEPRFTDVRLIPDMYKYFTQIECENPYERAMFVLVIIALYSPITLIEGRIPYGLRKAITNAIGYKSESVVSRSLSQTRFMVVQYKDVSELADKFIDALSERFRI